MKTKLRQQHLDDLDQVFQRLRRYNLKMNPFKCVFGVSSGWFLGFIVLHRRIKRDPKKITAIVEMPTPRNISELKRLQGRLAYIRRFISNLSKRCQPFSCLMKKGVPFEWDQACQNAFDSVKQYLLNPSVFMSPAPSKPLLLYVVAMDSSLRALLAQHNEEGKEHTLYYLNKTMVGVEINYSLIEKIYLALVFALQKLRHYLLTTMVHPLKYIISRPFVQGCITRWIVISLFDIHYVL